MKAIGVIDRCLECPFRVADADIADGTGDICRKKRKSFDYRAFAKKGEFPKWCPLKDAQ